MKLSVGGHQCDSCCCMRLGVYWDLLGQLQLATTQRCLAAAGFQHYMHVGALHAAAAVARSQQVRSRRLPADDHQRSSSFGQQQSIAIHSITCGSCDVPLCRAVARIAFHVAFCGTASVQSSSGRPAEWAFVMKWAKTLMHCKLISIDCRLDQIVHASDTYQCNLIRCSLLDALRASCERCGTNAQISMPMQQHHVTNW